MQLGRRWGEGCRHSGNGRTAGCKGPGSLMTQSNSQMDPGTTLPLDVALSEIDIKSSLLRPRVVESSVP